ncbi:MAG: glycosyltransferase, partial [Deltaproteobacteria bacterium]|nr:glycosyltransferase [Deltaproteobacteria bacterium]
MSKTGVLFINCGDVAGADTWVHAQLVRHLDRSRFEVHAACAPARSGVLPPVTAKLMEIPDTALVPTDFGPTFFNRGKLEKLAGLPRFLPAAASMLSLARYVRARRIRVVHSIDRPRDALACAVLARLTGARCVIHVHVKFDDWMGRGVRWAFSRADALLGVSEYVAATLVRGGYPKERTHAVLNGIPEGEWTPRDERASVRTELGLPPDAPLVLSASRLFRWKGHHELIAAFGQALPKVPGAHLVIAGSDYPPGSGTSRELQAQARGAGLGDRVHLIGERKDMARLLPACDGFAQASFEEPFVLVIAEAMAMEHPVIALRT